jgi:dTDP-4-dehydrorhamnose 3,5-epimerase
LSDVKSAKIMRQTDEMNNGVQRTDTPLNRAWTFGTGASYCIRERRPLRNGRVLMRFLTTTLADARLIALEPNVDERGAFTRVYCAREFADAGLPTAFVQHSISRNARKGTVRGLHFQKPPHEEDKIVRVSRGAIFDVIVDLRPASPTYRKWEGFELSVSNDRELYVPKGFAHGFQTLADDTEVHYLISPGYEPGAGSGVRFDDPAFGIAWPLPVASISEKDKGWALMG